MKKNKAKQMLLSLGLMATVASPLVTVISCGESDETAPEITVDQTTTLDGETVQGSGVEYTLSLIQGTTITQEAIEGLFTVEDDMDEDVTLTYSWETGPFEAATTGECVLTISSEDAAGNSVTYTLTITVSPPEVEGAGSGGGTTSSQGGGSAETTKTLDVQAALDKLTGSIEFESGTAVADDETSKDTAIALIKADASYTGLTTAEKEAVDAVLVKENATVNTADMQITFTDGTDSYTVTYTVAVTEVDVQAALNTLVTTIEFASGTTVHDNNATKNAAIDLIQASSEYSSLTADEKTAVDAFLVAGNATVDTTSTLITFTDGTSTYKVTYTVATDALEDGLSKIDGVAVELGSDVDESDKDATVAAAVAEIQASSEYSSLTADEKTAVDAFLVAGNATVDPATGTITFADDTYSCTVNYTVAVEEETVVTQGMLDKLVTTIEFASGTTVHDNNATKNAAIDLIQASSEYSSLTADEKTAVDAFLVAGNATVDTTSTLITFTDGTSTYKVTYTVATDALEDGLSKIDGVAVELGSDVDESDKDATVAAAVAEIQASSEYSSLTADEKTAVDAFLVAGNATVDPATGTITFADDTYSCTVNYTVAADALEDGLSKIDGVAVELGSDVDESDKDATVAAAVAEIQTSSEYSSLTADEKTAVDAFLVAGNATVDPATGTITFADDTYSCTVNYTVAVEEETVVTQGMLDKLVTTIEFASGTTVHDNNATKNAAIDLIQASSEYSSLTADEKTAVDAFLVAGNATVDTTSTLITFTDGTSTYKVTYTVATDALEDGLSKIDGVAVELGSDVDESDKDATVAAAVAEIQASSEYSSLTADEKTAVDAFLVAGNATVDPATGTITFADDTYSCTVNYTVAADALEDGLSKIDGVAVELGSDVDESDKDATVAAAVAEIQTSSEYSSLTADEKTAVDAFLVAGNATVDPATGTITFADDTYSCTVNYTVAVEEETVVTQGMLDKLVTTIEFASGTTVHDNNATKNAAIDLIQASSEYSSLTADEKTAVDAFLVAGNATVDTTSTLITFTDGTSTYKVTYTVAADALEDGLSKIDGVAVELGSDVDESDKDATVAAAVAEIQASSEYSSLTADEKTAVDAFLVAGNATVDPATGTITFADDTYSCTVNYTVAVEEETVS